MSWKPDITVAVIVEIGGRFLCVEALICNRRACNQPAGRLESGEDFRQAVCRETLEETAWHFEPRWFPGVYRWQACARPHTTRRTPLVLQRIVDYLAGVRLPLRAVAQLSRDPGAP